jgi:hypothetical protein
MGSDSGPAEFRDRAVAARLPHRPGLARRGLNARGPGRPSGDGWPGPRGGPGGTRRTGKPYGRDQCSLLVFLQA